MPLYLDLDQGDRVNIDDGRVVVEVVQKTGRRVRLSINADRSIPIVREGGTDMAKRSRDHPEMR